MSAEAGKPLVRPIYPDDLPAVGDFLNQHLNHRVSARAWMASLQAPWRVEPPNHGFMLVAADRVVGVYLAFYSERIIAGRSEPFCNLGAWVVLPEYRFHSLRLLNALLAQPGYHFTDLSPSGNTIPVNERLKFQRLDTTATLMINLPWPIVSRRTSVTSDPTVIERTLSGPDAQIYRDHRSAAAVHHLLIRCQQETCYVMFRRDRRRGWPLFATLLYVSDKNVLRRAARAVGRHLLLRHAIPATIVEARIAGCRLWPSVSIGANRVKMFKSATLSADHIDYLYSELVSVAW